MPSTMVDSNGGQPAQPPVFGSVMKQHSDNIKVMKNNYYTAVNQTLVSQVASSMQTANGTNGGTYLGIGGPPATTPH